MVNLVHLIVAGSFKVAKYHGASKDSVLLAVKRGEYEARFNATPAMIQLLCRAHLWLCVALCYSVHLYGFSVGM